MANVACERASKANARHDMLSTSVPVFIIEGLVLIHIGS